VGWIWLVDFGFLHRLMPKVTVLLKRHHEFACKCLSTIRMNL